ncbi:MAG: hypothetical protein KC800_25740 [Candidatus Eremiobacteraeota bacterium]|nr:hypothetical protein [Candidatus Eremiobacteraeota bacterium]
MKRRLYILVTGTRYAHVENLADIDRAISGEMDSKRYDSIEIVVGDADGVDALVRRWFHGAPVIQQPRTGWRADWDTHGKKAGPIRNQLMIDYVRENFETRASDDAIVVGFPASNYKSNGTKGCLKAAKTAGLPTIEIPIEIDLAVVRGERERFSF